MNYSLLIAQIWVHICSATRKSNKIILFLMEQNTSLFWMWNNVWIFASKIDLYKILCKVGQKILPVPTRPCALDFRVVDCPSLAQQFQLKRKAQGLFCFCPLHPLESTFSFSPHPDSHVVLILTECLLCCCTPRGATLNLAGEGYMHCTQTSPPGWGRLIIDTFLIIIHCMHGHRIHYIRKKSLSGLEGTESVESVRSRISSCLPRDKSSLCIPPSSLVSPKNGRWYEPKPSPHRILLLFHVSVLFHSGEQHRVVIVLATHFHVKYYWIANETRMRGVSITESSL